MCDSKFLVWHRVNNQNQNAPEHVDVFSLLLLRDYRCVLDKDVRLNLGDWIEISDSVNPDGRYYLDLNNCRIVDAQVNGMLPKAERVDGEVEMEVYAMFSSDPKHESYEQLIAWSRELERIYFDVKGGNFGNVRRDVLYKVKVARSSQEICDKFDVIWGVSENSTIKTADTEMQQGYVSKMKENMTESARHYPPGYGTSNAPSVSTPNYSAKYNTPRNDLEEDKGNMNRNRFNTDAPHAPKMPFGPNTHIQTGRTGYLSSGNKSTIPTKLFNSARKLTEDARVCILVKKDGKFGLAFCEKLRHVIIDHYFEERTTGPNCELKVGDWFSGQLDMLKKATRCSGFHVDKIVRKVHPLFETKVVNNVVQLSVDIAVPRDLDEKFQDSADIGDRRFVAVDVNRIGAVKMSHNDFQNYRGHRMLATISNIGDTSWNIVGWEVVGFQRELSPNETVFPDELTTEEIIPEQEEESGENPADLESEDDEDEDSDDDGEEYFKGNRKTNSGGHPNTFEQPRPDYSPSSENAPQQPTVKHLNEYEMIDPERFNGFKRGSHRTSDMPPTEYTPDSKPKYNYNEHERNGLNNGPSGSGNSNHFSHQSDAFSNVNKMGDNFRYNDQHYSPAPNSFSKDEFHMSNSEKPQSDYGSHPHGYDGEHSRREYDSDVYSESGRVSHSVHGGGFPSRTNYPSNRTTPIAMTSRPPANLPCPDPVRPRYEVDPNAPVRENLKGIICACSSSKIYIIFALETGAVVCDNASDYHLGVGDWVNFHATMLLRPIPGCKYVQIDKLNKIVPLMITRKPTQDFAELRTIIEYSPEDDDASDKLVAKCYSSDVETVYFSRTGIPFQEHIKRIYVEHMMDKWVCWIRPVMTERKGIQWHVSAVEGKHNEVDPNPVISDFYDPSISNEFDKIRLKFDELFGPAMPLKSRSTESVFARPGPSRSREDKPNEPRRYHDSQPSDTVQIDKELFDAIHEMWNYPVIKLGIKQANYSIFERLDRYLGDQSRMPSSASPSFGQRSHKDTGYSSTAPIAYSNRAPLQSGSGNRGPTTIGQAKFTARAAPLCPSSSSQPGSHMSTNGYESSHQRNDPSRDGYYQEGYRKF